jgi:hypothetical protein
LTKPDDGDDRVQKQSENAAHAQDGIKLKMLKNSGACGIRLPQVREGHKPNGGHERSGEVGLRRSTREPPNNEGQPSAEVGERRARTKENIAQSSMRPTQSGERMSQGLRGVRKAASLS